MGVGVEVKLGAGTGAGNGAGVGAVAPHQCDLCVLHICRRCQISCSVVALSRQRSRLMPTPTVR